jgi:phospholipid N-methyltransferase
MAETADLHNARAVVELGPGTGVFTEKIIERLHRDAVFFALELNHHFVLETKKRCPSATVYHDSAANISKYLRKHGAVKCDCIISSLPWGVFAPRLQMEIMSAIVDALHPQGEFLTYSYIGGQLLPAARSFRKMLSRYFPKVKKTPFVWRNIPPAFIYHCRK